MESWIIISENDEIDFLLLFFFLMLLLAGMTVFGCDTLKNFLFFYENPSLAAWNYLWDLELPVRFEIKNEKNQKMCHRTWLIRNVYYQKVINLYIYQKVTTLKIKPIDALETTVHPAKHKENKILSIFKRYTQTKKLPSDSNKKNNKWMTMLLI